MTAQYDVAVIGLGAMGSAALSYLAARGVKAIGIEAFHPAHALSSSHGDSRLIRLGYFEDPSYVPLLKQAYLNWQALETRLRSDILAATGVLQIGKPDSKIVAGTRASCQLHGLAYEELGREAMASRFPAFQLDPDEIAIFDPRGGYLRPEAAIAGYLKLAAQDGAVLHFGEKITAIEPDDTGVTIVSADARYRAKKVIVSTGVWIAELVPALRLHAQPIRQVVAWYQPRDGFAVRPERMPCFLRDEGEGGSYFGFPAIGAEGVKIGRHAHFLEPIDPNLPNPPVNDRDTALLDGFIAKRLPAAAGQRVNAVTCRYTMLPSEDFLIDLLPGDPRIVVASPCSGHGFKFASVIGEILADLALDGGTALPVSAFSFSAMEDFLAKRAAPDAISQTSGG
ncbi:N-methyl-L-tryptophan oxidase [Phyllobacterium leguminum]|uniref:Monomeric sarcosine oxidase n=1 Tax=Phyllobacterium leguminum TaxID=314237 RepID=A0A318T1T0_9HYPH|nr:N-methyl-L-tryptophan oxidase [Phyllobacterium leguminum]PYE86758.1 monomeric sarcosine oxidase [Phyllobacterium leguminum]